jgi:hypothetical protein
MFDSTAFDSGSFDENSVEFDALVVGGAFDADSFDLDAFDNGSFLFDDSVPSTDVIFLGAFLGSRTTLTLYFSDIVDIGSGGSAGLVSSLSGGAVTWTYASGAGTNKITYTASRRIDHKEFGSGSYTNPGNGIEDQNGNDIDSMSFVIWNRITFVPIPRPMPRRNRWWW